jgi:hypothetical protein
MGALMERWSVRLPVAFIATMLLQTVAVVWWAARVNADVDQLKREVVSAQHLRERIVRLETKLETIERGVEEVKAILRARIPPP